jgi:hypothetical protein
MHGSNKPHAVSSLQEGPARRGRVSAGDENEVIVTSGGRRPQSATNHWDKHLPASPSSRSVANGSRPVGYANANEGPLWCELGESTFEKSAQEED